MNHGHETIYPHHQQHPMADRDEMDMMAEGLEPGEYQVSFISFCQTVYVKICSKQRYCTYKMFLYFHFLGFP